VRTPRLLLTTDINMEVYSCVLPTEGRREGGEVQILGREGEG